MGQGLSLEEAASRVAAHNSPSVVNALYDFGKLLFSEGISRTSQLESKATIVVGYSGAILAFLLSHTTPYPPTLLGGCGSVVILLAAIAAFFALLLAFWAGRIHKWRWVGEAVWVPSRLPIERPEEALTLHYFESLFEAHQELSRANRQKGDFVHAAQWLLIISLVLLSVALLAQWSAGRAQ